MLERKTPPRLTVDLTDEMAAGLARIPWGMRKVVFHVLIMGLNKMMDRTDPEKVVGAIIAGDITLEDLT